jgi:hypothetical protein
MTGPAVILDSSVRSGMFIVGMPLAAQAPLGAACCDGDVPKRAMPLLTELERLIVARRRLNLEL